MTLRLDLPELYVVGANYRESKQTNLTRMRESSQKTAHLDCSCVVILGWDSRERKYSIADR
jgi:hypothetical protein